MLTAPGCARILHLDMIRKPTDIKAELPGYKTIHIGPWAYHTIVLT